MASLPNSRLIALKRAVISSSASSHEIRWKPSEEFDALLLARGPLDPVRRMGYNTRSGEYTRSRYLETFAHRKPRVTGWDGSPCTRMARPSSTVMSTPQASGQSCEHAAWMTLFMASMDYMIISACSELTASLWTSTVLRSHWKNWKRKLWKRKLKSGTKIPNGPWPVRRSLQTECPRGLQSKSARRHCRRLTFAAFSCLACRCVQYSRRNSLVGGFPRYSVSFSAAKVV